MNELKKIRLFLGWFEDNFGDEKYLMEEYNPQDDTIDERWISYLDHPEYLAACEALDELENKMVKAGFSS